MNREWLMKRDERGKRRRKERERLVDGGLSKMERGEKGNNGK